jgi:hypothetical protein
MRDDRFVDEIDEVVIEKVLERVKCRCSDLPHGQFSDVN